MTTLDVSMRVLLDMRWMIPGRAGGVEHMARAFFRHLTTLDSHNMYTALVPAQCRHDFVLPGRTNFRTTLLDTPPGLQDLDVEIAYSFTGYIYADVFPLRHVLVVPDIQHEYFPEFFSPEALQTRSNVYTDAARRADHICAISEFTRRTLIDRLGTPPEKVTTILLAADPRFSPEPHDDARVLQSYGLERGEYLYFPAHTWHHKNHRVAIEALRVLRDRHGVRPTLICTGQPREAQSAIEADIAKWGLSGQVRFLGYCPEGDLPSFYRGAACLVYPSLFEGFGMPVLEAMASGCPVVCSDTTSLPEIAGDAARLVSPTDPEALAATLHQVLTETDLRLDLRARGLQRAASFSWHRHTLETIAVLRSVHDQMRMR